MKTVIAITLIIAAFFTIILWCCCCAASRADRLEEQVDNFEK